MISLGCDIGALATKTVIFMDGVLAAYDIMPNEGRLSRIAEVSVKKVLSETGLSLNEIENRVGTGWGRRYIPFPHVSETMIRCLARGAHWMVPESKTVVNIGGLSTTVVSIRGEGGRVIEYRTNDRCASGTGFFLEMAAQALELTVEELGSIALSAKRRAHISAQCAVFGESEIVTHVNDGTDPAEIIAGIVYSIGANVASMARRLSLEREVVVTGGVAKNEGIMKALEEHLGFQAARVRLDPQIAGAVGAALLALENK